MIFYNNKVGNAIPIVEEFIITQPDSIDIDKLGRGVGSLGWAYTYNPNNGSLRSAISSGDIHLIRNSQLVKLLFCWEDVVKDAEEEALLLRETGNHFRPLIAKYIRNRRQNSIHPSDFAGLINEPLFEDYVAQKESYYHMYRTELDILRSDN